MVKLTKKLHSNSDDYKDFFNNAEYLSEVLNEISYRKVIISEESIPKEIPGQNLVFIERIRAGNILGVYKYLDYKLPKLNNKLLDLKRKKFYNNNDDSTLKYEIIKVNGQIRWFEKNINFFKKKLSNIEKSHTFITPKYGFFCNSYDKILYNSNDEDKKDNQKLVGRLYSHESIQGLSSEIRYYLFKGEYRDFDLVNAHPSILYEFTKQQNIKLNGSLKQYVENRSFMFQEIRKELIEYEKLQENVLSDKVIKKRILTLSNRFENYERTPILKKLFQDFETIREHLFRLFRNDDFFTEEEKLEYNRAIRNSVNKKFKNSNLNNVEVLGKAKVILQVFYCQTQESYHIIRLSDFLRKKYLIYLDKDNIKEFTDYYPNTDKKVNLSAIHTLFVIPFFDGLYVSSPNMTFNNSLLSFVDEFNNLNKESSIRFEHKIIEQKIENIEDTKELEKFMIIRSWLSKQSSKKNWNIFLKRSGLTTKFSTELKYLEFNAKIISLDAEEEDEYWEDGYKTLVAQLMSDIYDKLLLMEFNDEHELNIRIKSINKMKDPLE